MEVSSFETEASRKKLENTAFLKAKSMFSNYRANVFFFLFSRNLC